MTTTIDRLLKLNPAAKQAVETVADYLLRQVGLEPGVPPGDVVRIGLTQVRAAVSCLALAAELCLDDQEQALDLFADLDGTAHETPRSGDTEDRGRRVSDLLLTVGLDLASWRLRANVDLESVGQELPACETLRHGDWVEVRAGCADHAFHGRAGTFLEYTDPRVGHQARYALVRLGGASGAARVVLRPSELRECTHLVEDVPEGSEIPDRVLITRDDPSKYLGEKLARVWVRDALADGWTTRGDHDSRDGGDEFLILERGDHMAEVAIFDNGSARVSLFKDKRAVPTPAEYSWSAILAAETIPLQWSADQLEWFESLRTSEPAGQEARPPARVDLSEHELLATWSHHGFTLRLYDTHRVDRQGKSTLAYELVDEEHGEDPIFSGDDFHASPMHAVDSDATAASLLSFLSLRPGDTDREYFDSYSAEQLDWCQARGEDLALLAEELRQPYRPVEHHEIEHETWDEARQAGRHNRALVLSYRERGGEEHRVTLSAGESDHVDVLTDGETVYALTVNYHLGYVGLECWVAGEGAGDVFFQTNVEEELGEGFWDLGTVEMLQRLVEHLPR